MKTKLCLAALLTAAAACKTAASSRATVRTDDDASPGEAQSDETAEAGPLTANKFTAMDVAILFPARDKADIDNLMKLDDAPAAGQGFSIRGDGPIITKTMFDNFINRGRKMADKIDAVPDYSRWRIVGVRPLFCARIRTVKETAAEQGQGTAAEKIQKGIYPNGCVVEHRLVAQPLNAAGTGFLDFSLHIISRPFQPGTVENSRNLDLAANIAISLAQIKARAGANDSNGKGFGVYPALAARDPAMLKMIKAHVTRFYGGKFMATLAFMGSKADKSWLFYSGPSNTNQLSDLIRPGSNRFDPKPVAFEIADQTSGKTVLDFLNGGGVSQTIDGKPTQSASSGALKPFPELSALFAGKTDAAAIGQAALMENISEVALSDTDCVSCHHVTAAANLLGLRAKVNAHTSAFQAQGQQPVAAGTLQARKENFINLGYFTPVGGATELSVSQELINDATEQAILVESLKAKLLKSPIDLRSSQATLTPVTDVLAAPDAPDFEPVNI